MPISCGGISINPGDIIVMDQDGVIVIPWQEGETVLEAAKAFQAQDEAKLVAAQTGNSKREWLTSAWPIKASKSSTACTKAKP